MKNYLLLFLSISTTLLTAQNNVFTDEEKEDIYNHFLEERPYDLLPQEIFIVSKFLQFEGEEVMNASKYYQDQQIKIMHTDSGYVFYNISESQATASYGLMKDIYVDFDEVHRSEDIEQHIYFDWYFQNTYDGISGVSKVKIRRQFSPDEEDVYLEIWIEVPANTQRKPNAGKGGYTLFMKAELAKDIDKKNHPLFRL